MPGIVDAINAFLEMVNKSGVPEKLRDTFSKRREDEARLHDNVQAMKDAPEPTKPGGSNGR